jgi:hypothetical protein
MVGKYISLDQKEKSTIGERVVCTSSKRINAAMLFLSAVKKVIFSPMIVNLFN